MPNVTPGDMLKAAQRGEPSFVWRDGQQRRLEMIRQAAGERVAGFRPVAEELVITEGIIRSVQAGSVRFTGINGASNAVGAVGVRKASRVLSVYHHRDGSGC